MQSILPYQFVLIVWRCLQSGFVLASQKTASYRHADNTNQTLREGHWQPMKTIWHFVNLLQTYMTLDIVNFMIFIAYFITCILCVCVVILTSGDNVSYWVKWGTGFVLPRDLSLKGNWAPVTVICCVGRTSAGCTSPHPLLSLHHGG